MEHRGRHVQTSQLAYFLQQILTSAARFKVDIHSLELDLTTKIEIDGLLDGQPGVLESTKSLQTLCYNIYRSDQQDIDPEESNLNCIVRILASASSLKKLHVQQTDSLGLHSAPPQYAADIILANCLDTLTTLVVDDVRFKNFEPLFEALSRCQGTLIRLELTSITVLSFQNRWEEIIRLMGTMPNLTDLEGIGFYIERDGRSYMMCWLDKDDEDEAMVEVFGDSQEKIKTAVSKALDKSMVLRRDGYFYP